MSKQIHKLTTNETFSVGLYCELEYSFHQNKNSFVSIQIKMQTKMLHFGNVKEKTKC